MNQPLMLDVCCGGGGAAWGYHLAGFDLVGVDNARQKHYPFWYVQADALDYLRQCAGDYDAIHVSPPCQAFCALKHLAKTQERPNLIPQIRALLDASGKPYIIENVVGAPLLNPKMLCGTMFGLRTACGAELRRHRLFETNWPLRVEMECAHYHSQKGTTIGVYGDNPRSSIGDKPKTISVCGHSSPGMNRTICVNGTGMATSGGTVIGVYGSKPHNEAEVHKRRTISITGSTPQTNVERNKVRECFSVGAAQTAMGIDWLPMSKLSQAIPPAYTRFIGEQLLRYLKGAQP